MIVTNVSEDTMEKLSRGALNAVLVPEPPELLESSKIIVFHRDTKDAPFTVKCKITSVSGLEIFSDGIVQWPKQGLMQGNTKCSEQYLQSLGIALGYSGWQNFLTINFSTLFPAWSFQARVSGNRNVHEWSGSVVEFE